ncbi:hypothetical protein [Cohaesibacter haloalkalitolerans]|uniref:hypothetical protein n=1 Tax=Cohaesibacter haloalkalitolerans TaxID=1162980 RepID=UPI0013C4973F|nr:hypothetical protein [Cohaesibacter haloalkalitolerans]
MTASTSKLWRFHERTQTRLPGHLDRTEGIAARSANWADDLTPDYGSRYQESPLRAQARPKSLDRLQAGPLPIHLLFSSRSSLETHPAESVTGASGAILLLSSFVECHPSEVANRLFPSYSG